MQKRHIIPVPCSFSTAMFVTRLLQNINIFSFREALYLEGEQCLSLSIMDKLFIIPLSHGYSKPRAIRVMSRFEVEFHILVKKFSEFVNNY